MNVVCQTGPCKTTLSSQCVYYMGENLIYTGINTNDSVQVALQKLNTFLAETLPTIGSEQISFEKDVFQITHGLIVGDAIRLSGSIWIKAQANTLSNSGTVGVVSAVFSANNFTYQSGGWLVGGGPWVDGISYFLDTTIPGNIVPEEIYDIGEVREFVGTGTPDGLLLELDLGDLYRTVVVDENLEVSLLSKSVLQVGHGFSPGQAIKLENSTWITSQGDLLVNSGTIGIVFTVLDVDNFIYQFGGLLTTGGPWTDGTSYFLDTIVSGGIVPEQTYVEGEVREFIGTGTPDGLLIELDLGDLHVAPVLDGEFSSLQVEVSDLQAQLAILQDIVDQHLNP